MPARPSAPRRQVRTLPAHFLHLGIAGDLVEWFDQWHRLGAGQERIPYVGVGDSARLRYDKSRERTVFEPCQWQRRGRISG